MDDVQRSKREASPVAGCSSQLIKKPKSEIEFHLSEKIAKSADVLKDFWLSDNPEKGVQVLKIIS